MPRPRKLCEIKQRDLCALISVGCPLSVAARHVGCSIFTIRREARRNPTFQEQLRGSQLATEMTPIATLREAATSDWRAAAWLLERTQPQDFGRRGPNTLGRHELIELVDRLGDIVRDEIRDRRQSARLRQRIRVEVQVVLRKLQTLSIAEKSSPLAIVEGLHEEQLPEHQAPDNEIDRVAASNMEAECEQNEAKRKAYMIGGSDIPYGESWGIPLASA